MSDRVTERETNRHTHRQVRVAERADAGSIDVVGSWISLRVRQAHTHGHGWFVDQYARLERHTHI